MTVPYLLRFCPFRALMCMLFGIHTQGVASLALGYALVGLSARPCLNHKLQSCYLLPQTVCRHFCLNAYLFFRHGVDELYAARV